MPIKTEDTENCPLCQRDNNCCNSLNKSLGNCWCSDKVFPNGIFELVPTELLRKSCICENCLQKFEDQ